MIAKAHLIRVNCQEITEKASKPYRDQCAHGNKIGIQQHQLRTNWINNRTP